MSITATATQQLSIVVVEWTFADFTPTGPWTITRSVNGADSVPVASMPTASSRMADRVDELDAGDVLDYEVANEAEPIPGEAQVTLTDPATQPTYGPVDPLVDTPRYTTVDDVKKATGITDTSFDDDIEQAIIAGEIAMDTFNGRSFPDTGLNPAVPGIPEPIRVWALDVAIGIFKARDTVFGEGGSDDWIGIVNVDDEVRRALRRNPLALGHKIGDGFGIA